MTFEALTLDGPARLLAKAGRAAQDLVFPHHAFDAGSRAASPGLTPEGWSRIAFLEAPSCDSCGLPFDYDMGYGVRCPACEARPKAFSRARAACFYDEHSRDLILQFKHADRLDLARLFSLWLSRAAADLPGALGEAVGGQAHPACRRRHDHRLDSRGLRQGPDPRRGGVRRCRGDRQGARSKPRFYMSLLAKF